MSATPILQLPSSLSNLRTSPAAHNVERIVLSNMICNAAALENACERLKSEDFDDPRHRTLFEELFRLRMVERKAINPQLLVDELAAKMEAIGGIAYLVETSEFAPGAVHLEQYIGTLKEKTIRRRMLVLAMEVTRLATEEGGDIRDALSTLERLITEMGSQYTTGGYLPLQDVLSDLFETVEGYHAAPGEMRGVASGYGLLDYMTGGFRGGDLIVLAARPSMGKTAFALNMAQNVAKEKPVLMFSLEMGINALAMRLLCSESGLDSHKVHQGRCNDHEWEHLSNTFEELSRLNLFIDDSPNTTPFYVSSKARQLMSLGGGLGMVVVDYLTLLRPNTRFDSMNQQVSELSRAMKAVARELDVPVLVLSQLNRELEKTKDKRPQLSHLRESGAIEQDADLVMFLHRPDYWAQTGADEEAESGAGRSQVMPLMSEAELILAKHRNGPTGSVPLVFHRDKLKFASVARSAE